MSVAFFFIWAFIQSFIVGLTIGIIKKAVTNFILSSVFLIMSFNILFQYLFRYTDLKYEYARTTFLPDVLDFLLPSLILFYVDSLLGRKISKVQYWYFLPSITVFLLLTIYVITIPDFGFKDYNTTIIHKVILFLLVVWKSFIFYRLMTILKINDDQLTSKQSNLLQWPKVLMIFVGFTMYTALVQFLNTTFFVPYLSDEAMTWVRKLVQLNYILINSSIILVTIYFVIKFPKILSGGPIIKALNAQKFPDGMLYEKRLHQLIEEEKIHLDTELNEKGLAEKMKIHSYILSKLLNEHIGKSFSEFINEKRVEEAKRLLKEDIDNELTNFAVAVDSGFKSESVFYVNFKKITGMTPTQYKKKASI